MNSIARLDHRYFWHPFTQMRDWVKSEPIVIVQGNGAVLRDVDDREYLDANSSIWTNLHGHNHPRINAALRSQLGKIAHSSTLGLTNEPASLLSAELVKVANPPALPGDRMRRKVSNPRLNKVFFSDDGSTAMEVALKLAYEFSRRAGQSKRPRFLSLDGAYHGDTVGAVALGHIQLFHGAYAGLLFKTDRAMAPYCYRCPYNRAKPERTDAREYRKCNWECLGHLERGFSKQKRKREPYAAFVFEPLIQGAAGMIAQPKGWLGKAAEIARAHDALLIADEVMTGFGRTGAASLHNSSMLFASHQEGVQPDFMALAKGLTGGYLPMAATLVTEAIYKVFLGDYAEFKTFFHGHSYTGNQLGAAAARANLDILKTHASKRARAALERTLSEELRSLWLYPNVGDVRQVGLIAGIELVKNWRTREPFPLSDRAGIRVCDIMRKLGVLTRPIGNVVVLMPPYCTTSQQMRQIVAALRQAITSTFGDSKNQPLQSRRWALKQKPSAGQTTSPPD
jgi:adenosylmethionine---8-amino-7-oxononanoate aminotransferase